MSEKSSEPDIRPRRFNVAEVPGTDVDTPPCPPRFDVRFIKDVMSVSTARCGPKRGL
jgi:hypothetical protein